ncbi:MAG: DNA mismatch repair endonuclease MutL, partial [Clostridiales bacterium]|nr:DNA mismatch repair endonuclease MutL [Clostridiales bacterium]
MAKIRMLPDDLIGKIAAGEVVERPAAAIKELVENSLDAGATRITVEIEEGGIHSFRVTDDGCGIDESDLRMAFERHATSKIRTVADLDAIGTLGFRGEALASIAAVGKVTLTTRTRDRETGIRVKNEGGTITDISEAACAPGTGILVRDLFFNVPVRRGFLKKPSTEANAVTDLMAHLILSRPDVSFRYTSDGKTVYHSPGDGRMESSVLTVYGSQAARTMRPVDGHQGGVLLRGFVGIGENARNNRSGENFFINGRMLRSPLLSGSLEDACRERVMIGKFPVCVLYLEMAPENVNVNVHPNKMEVRFRFDQQVREAVFTLVLEALRDRDAFEKPVEMPLTEPRENELPDPPASRPGETPALPVYATIETEKTVPA